MFRYVTAGALLVGALTLVPTPAVAATNCANAAHRGNHEQAGVTENGMPAFRAARKTFETDVRTNASGALVIMHDATVRRTTTGYGRVSNLTSRQWRALRLNDGSAAPFLNNVLRYLHYHPRKHAVLDLLAASGTQVVGRVRAWGVTSQVTIMSQQRADLDAANRYTATAFLSGVAVDPANYAAYDAVAVWDGAVTPEAVQQAHASKMEYWTWTPDQQTDWASLIAAGVDLTITNRPTEFSAYCSTA